MTVEIYRIDKSLPLPKFQTSGSVGFDLYVRETTKIKPKELAIIPLNNIIKTPEGYGLFIFSRSSLAKRKGLILANSVGVIDQDYCGPNDELKALVYNFTDKEVIVEKGERIVQGVFIRVYTPNFKEVDNIEGEDRGGFGSTGDKL